jgi:hypothetical protein
MVTVEGAVRKPGGYPIKGKLSLERGPHQDIRAALRERNTDEIFSRLYRALDSFRTEIESLPSKPPDNFESTLRPYAVEAKLAATALANWASDTRTYAETQSKELNSPR